MTTTDRSAGSEHSARARWPRVVGVIASAWPPVVAEPRHVTIAHVPVEATMYGEPVRPHVRFLIAEALRRAGHRVDDVAIGRTSDIEDLARRSPESIVFNLCYGLRPPDGMALGQPDVAAAMEAAGLSLIGSGAAAQFGCQDKSSGAQIAEDAGVATPREFTLDEALEQPGPLIVKPREGAAHRDVKIVTDPSSLASDPPGDTMMIQEYLDGPEYTIGVLGNDECGIKVLPLTRVRLRRAGTEPAVYDWSTTTMAPDSGNRFGIAAAAERLFEAYGLVDYARFDVRVVAGRGPVLLDANALPNLAPRQLLATSARWAGLTYPRLISAITTAAIVRNSATTPSATRSQTAVDVPG